MVWYFSILFSDSHQGLCMHLSEQQIHVPLHPSSFTSWWRHIFFFHYSHRSVVLPVPAWTAGGCDVIWMMASVKKAPPLHMHCRWLHQQGTKIRTTTIFYLNNQMGNMIDTGHSSQLHPCCDCKRGLGPESQPPWHVELSWHISLDGDLLIWVAVGGENSNLPLIVPQGNEHGTFL